MTRGPPAKPRHPRRPSGDTPFDRVVMVICFLVIPACYLGYSSWLQHSRIVHFVSGVPHEYRVHVDDRWFTLPPKKILEVPLPAGVHTLRIEAPNGTTTTTTFDTSMWILATPFSSADRMHLVNPDRAAVVGFEAGPDDDWFVLTSRLFFEVNPPFYLGGEPGDRRRLVFPAKLDIASKWIFEADGEEARVANLRARLAFDPGDTEAAAALAAPPPTSSTTTPTMP